MFIPDSLHLTAHRTVATPYACCPEFAAELKKDGHRRFKLFGGSLRINDQETSAVWPLSWRTKKPLRVVRSTFTRIGSASRAIFVGFPLSGRFTISPDNSWQSELPNFRLNFANNALGSPFCASGKSPTTGGFTRSGLGHGIKNPGTATVDEEKWND